MSPFSSPKIRRQEKCKLKHLTFLLLLRGELRSCGVELLYLLTRHRVNGLYGCSKLTKGSVEGSAELAHKETERVALGPFVLLEPRNHELSVLFETRRQVLLMRSK